MHIFLSNGCIPNLVVFQRSDDGNWRTKDGITIQYIDGLSVSKEKHISIDNRSYLKLSSWAQDTNSTEIWLFAREHIFGHTHNVIIHAMKINDDHASFVAQLSLSPTRGNSYSFILINRKDKLITFTHTNGEIQHATIPEFTQDEKKSIYYTMEGMNLTEISDLCCWSESKSRKVRNLLLAKFHADNIVQLIKINDIFNICTI